MLQCRKFLFYLVIINFKYVFDIIPPPFPTYLHVALLHFTTSLIYNRYYLTRYGLPSEPWTRLKRMIHLHITHFPPIKPVNQMSFLKEEVIMSLMNQYFFSFFFVLSFLNVIRGSHVRKVREQFRLWPYYLHDTCTSEYVFFNTP